MGYSNNGTRRRVLVVEDQMLIAMVIEDLLTDLDCEVVGPAATLESAVELATAENPDAAILDVNLDGQKVFPLAEQLQRRKIPFIFSTGYSDYSLPEKWHDTPRLSKPFNRDQLEALLENLPRLTH